MVLVPPGQPEMEELNVTGALEANDQGKYCETMNGTLERLLVPPCVQFNLMAGHLEQPSKGGIHTRLSSDGNNLVPCR